MRKFVFLALFTIICLFLGRFYYYLQAEKTINQIIQNLSPYVLISYNSLDVSLFGEMTLKEVTINSVAEQPIVRLNELNIRDYEFSEQYPIKLDVSINQLMFEARPNIETNKLGFYELGYRSITTNMHLYYFYNEMANRIQFKINFDVDDVADFNNSIEFANFDISQWRYYLHDPSSILFMNIMLEYNEKGLVKRILKKIGEEQEISNTALIDLINKQLSQEPKKSEYLNEMSEQWRIFLINPENIKLSANVEEGISIRQLLENNRSPIQVLQKMNARVKANID